MTSSLLIDNSILSYGKFAKIITVDVPNFGNRLMLIEAFPRRPDEQAWLRKQIEALPTIAKVARDPTKLKLYTYFELEAEYWRGGNFPDTTPGNVFSNVPITRAVKGICRSDLMTASGGEIVSVAAQIQFCEWLLNGDRIAKTPRMQGRLDDTQIDILKQLNRYREICKSLASKHYPDAMHVWTGELNDIELFLTTDATLMRALQNNKKLKLRCCPIFPEQLLIRQAITEREPLPYEYGRRYYLNGRPYYPTSSQ
jgi:hypothetical protein